MVSAYSTISLVEFQVFLPTAQDFHKVLATS